MTRRGKGPVVSFNVNVNVNDHAATPARRSRTSPVTASATPTTPYGRVGTDSAAQALHHAVRSRRDDPPPPSLWAAHLHAGA